MTEEDKDVQLEDAEESKAPPVPKISSSSPSASSFNTDELSSKVTGQIMEQLSAIIDDRVDSRFKSAKDKRFAKVDEILEAVKASGGDPDRIREDLYRKEYSDRLEAIEKAFSSGGDFGKSPAGDGTSHLEAQTNEILSTMEKKYGISFSEDDLNALAGSKEYSSSEEWLTDVAEAGIKKAKQASISPSAIVGKSGKPAPVEDDLGGLTEELNAIYVGKKGNPFSPENIKRSDELLQKINEIDPMVDVDDDEQYIAAKARGYRRGAIFEDVAGGLPAELGINIKVE